MWSPICDIMLQIREDFYRLNPQIKREDTSIPQEEGHYYEIHASQLDGIDIVEDKHKSTGIIKRIAMKLFSGKKGNDYNE